MALRPEGASGRREDDNHVVGAADPAGSGVFAHGWLLLAPPPEIAVQMNASLPRAFWVFLGWAEILAAVGLTLPAATRILPGLVPAAAVGIMIVMISATVYHIVRAEYLRGVDHDGAARDGHVRGVRTLAPRAYPPAERCMRPTRH